MTTPGEKSEGLQSSALAAPTDGSENTGMATADFKVASPAASPVATSLSYNQSDSKFDHILAFMHSVNSNMANMELKLNAISSRLEAVESSKTSFDVHIPGPSAPTVEMKTENTRYELNSLPEPAKSVSSSVEAQAAVFSIPESETANQLDPKALIKQQCQDSTSRLLHFDHTVSVKNVYATPSLKGDICLENEQFAHIPLAFGSATTQPEDTNHDLSPYQRDLCQLFDSLPKDFYATHKALLNKLLEPAFFEQFGINFDLVQLWQEIVLDSLRGGHHNILVKLLKSDSAVLRAFFSKPIVQRILFDQYLWQAYFRYPQNDKHWQFESTSPFILTCFDDVFAPMLEKNSASSIVIINKDTCHICTTLFVERFKSEWIIAEYEKLPKTITNTITNTIENNKKDIKMDNSTNATSAPRDAQQHTLPIAQGSGNLSAPPSITLMNDERQEFFISASFLEFRGKVLTPGSSVNTTLPSLLRSPFILADRDVKKWFNNLLSTNQDFDVKVGTTHLSELDYNKQLCKYYQLRQLFNTQVPAYVFALDAFFAGALADRLRQIPTSHGGLTESDSNWPPNAFDVIDLEKLEWIISYRLSKQGLFRQPNLISFLEEKMTSDWWTTVRSICLSAQTDTVLFKPRSPIKVDDMWAILTFVELHRAVPTNFRGHALTPAQQEIAQFCLKSVLFRRLSTRHLMALYSFCSTSNRYEVISSLANAACNLKAVTANDVGHPFYSTLRNLATNFGEENTEETIVRQLCSTLSNDYLTAEFFCFLAHWRFSILFTQTEAHTPEPTIFVARAFAEELSKLRDAPRTENALVQNLGAHATKVSVKLVSSTHEFDFKKDFQTLFNALLEILSINRAHSVLIKMARQLWGGPVQHHAPALAATTNRPESPRSAFQMPQSNNQPLRDSDRAALSDAWREVPLRQVGDFSGTSGPTTDGSMSRESFRARFATTPRGSSAEGRVSGNRTPREQGAGSRERTPPTGGNRSAPVSPRMTPARPQIAQPGSASQPPNSSYRGPQEPFQGGGQFPRRPSRENFGYYGGMDYPTPQPNSFLPPHIQQWMLQHQMSSMGPQHIQQMGNSRYNQLPHMNMQFDPYAYSMVAPYYYQSPPYQPGFQYQHSPQFYGPPIFNRPPAGYNPNLPLLSNGNSFKPKQQFEGRGRSKERASISDGGRGGSRGQADGFSQNGGQGRQNRSKSRTPSRSPGRSGPKSQGRRPSFGQDTTHTLLAQSSAPSYAKPVVSPAAASAIRNIQEGTTNSFDTPEVSSVFQSRAVASSSTFTSLSEDSEGSDSTKVPKGKPFRPSRFRTSGCKDKPLRKNSSSGDDDDESAPQAAKHTTGHYRRNGYKSATVPTSGTSNSSGSSGTSVFYATAVIDMDSGSTVSSSSSTTMTEPRPRRVPSKQNTHLAFVRQLIKLNFRPRNKGRTVRVALKKAKSPAFRPQTIDFWTKITIATLDHARLEVFYLRPLVSKWENIVQKLVPPQPERFFPFYEINYGDYEKETDTLVEIIGSSEQILQPTSPETREQMVSGLVTEAFYQNIALQQLDLRVRRFILRRQLRVASRPDTKSRLIRQIVQLSTRTRRIGKFLTRDRKRQAALQRKEEMQDFDRLIQSFVINDAELSKQGGKIFRASTKYSSPNHAELRLRLKKLLRENYDNHIFRKEQTSPFEKFFSFLEQFFERRQTFGNVPASTTINKHIDEQTLSEFKGFLLRVLTTNVPSHDMNILGLLIDAFNESDVNHGLISQITSTFYDIYERHHDLHDNPLQLFQLFVEFLPPHFRLPGDGILRFMLQNFKRHFPLRKTVSYQHKDISYRPRPKHTHNTTASCCLQTSVFSASRDTLSSIPPTSAIIDSGCPISMTNQRALLSNIRKCNFVIQTAKNDPSGTITAHERGDLHFYVRAADGELHRCLIRGVLYAPQAPHTLLGTHQLNTHNHQIVLDYPYPSFVRLDRQYNVPLSFENGLYLLPMIDEQIKLKCESNDSDCSLQVSPAFSSVIAKQEKTMKHYDLWHSRLCHVGPSTVCRAHNHLTGMPAVRQDLDKSRVCHACKAASTRRSNKKHSSTRPARILEWWSLDTMIVKQKAITGAVVLNLFVDDLSKYCIGFPNASRSEHRNNLLSVMNFLHFLNTQFDTDYQITRIRTDCAPEFQTNNMLKFYAFHHITHQTTTPYNPRQNGIVERKGGTIAQMMRAIMIAGNVPVIFWPFAALHAIYVHNRLPQIKDVSGRIYSPFELLYKKKASAKDIHVFACLVFLYLPRELHQAYGRNWKFQFRGLPCVYLGLGYFRGQKCFLGWSPHFKKFFASDTGIFDEDFRPFQPPGYQSAQNLQSYSPSSELPDDLIDVSEETFPECKDLPVQVVEWDPTEDLWTLEADEVITVEILRSYHHLQQIEIFGDIPDVPEGDDFWSHYLAQQSRGTLQNIETEVHASQRFELRHPYSLMVDDLVSADSRNLLETYSNDATNSAAVQQDIDQQKEYHQHCISELLQKHVSDTQALETANTKSSEVSIQEAIASKAKTDDISIVGEGGNYDSKSESLNHNYLEWEQSMIPMLLAPIDFNSHDETVEYLLTTGQRTFVPFTEVVSMHDQGTPLPLGINQGDCMPLGSSTISQNRRHAQKDFQHFDSQGKPIGTLSLIAKAVGSKWKKLKAKAARNDDDSPKSWKDCLNSEERELWIEAVYQELLSLHLRGTFTLEHLPKDSSNCQIYSARLVCRKKRNAFTNAIKCKARIVVQGYTQVEGIDYYNTFSPTVGPIAVRTLIACATHLGYRLYHIDITTAFLSANIDNPHIYVRPPKGLEEPDGRLWKLKKVLYGLKQSPRLWYKEVTQTLRNSPLALSI